MDVLEYDVGVRAIGDGQGRCGSKTRIARGALCLLDLLLGGRMAQRDGDSHAKWGLGLVEGAQRGFVVVLQAATIGLDVVAALGLAAGKSGYGKGWARG